MEIQNQLAKVEGHSMKEMERAKQLQTIEMQIEYEKRRALTEVIINNYFLVFIQDYLG